MGAKLLRLLGLFAYGLLVVAVFGLAAYTSFSLFVRSGITTVPSVLGMTRAEAAAVLADQGLALRRVAEKGRYDDQVPAGRVLRQEPDPRTVVKRGSGVELVLSAGPQRVEVPNLEGKAFSAAQAALSGTGLGIGNALAAFRGGEPAGTILGQDPDPGAMVPPATGVNLLLAEPGQGERFIMPDLIYRQYEEVRPFFERHGFSMGSVKFERYEGVGTGVILRQFPLPGHPLARGDAVSLVVATEEEIPEPGGFDPGADDAPPPAG
jgi:eukaryotic-like serine/threonine-protein kinase